MQELRSSRRIPCRRRGRTGSSRRWSAGSCRHQGTAAEGVSDPGPKGSNAGRGPGSASRNSGVLMADRLGLDDTFSGVVDRNKFHRLDYRVDTGPGTPSVGPLRRRRLGGRRPRAGPHPLLLPSRTPRSRRGAGERERNPSMRELESKKERSIRKTDLALGIPTVF